MKARRFAAIPAVLLMVALLGAFAAPAGFAGGSELRVFAASSLADAFGEIGKRFEKAHPGFAVQLNLAGSQLLAAQIEQGANADVFASADMRWMDFVKERELISGEAELFAQNLLVVITPRSNPGRISKLQDLSRRGIKMVMGAESVPVGRYGRELLKNLSRTEGFPSDYGTRVLRNLVSEEENVKSVVSKVQLGEADAGIVYRSDVSSSVSRYIKVLAVPDSANVLATYPISVLKEARQPDAARQFVELVLSAEGQSILERRGLIPIKHPSP